MEINSKSLTITKLQILYIAFYSPSFVNISKQSFRCELLLATTVHKLLSLNRCVRLQILNINFICSFFLISKLFKTELKTWFKSTTRRIKYQMSPLLTDSRNCQAFCSHKDILPYKHIQSCVYTAHGNIKNGTSDCQFPL